MGAKHNSACGIAQLIAEILAAALDKMLDRMPIVGFMPNHVIGGERQQAPRRFLERTVERLVQFMAGHIGRVSGGGAPQQRRAKRQPDNQARRDRWKNPQPIGHAQALIL
jgi:hypothetical protein